MAKLRGACIVFKALLKEFGQIVKGWPGVERVGEGRRGSERVWEGCSVLACQPDTQKYSSFLFSSPNAHTDAPSREQPILSFVLTRLLWSAWAGAPYGGVRVRVGTPPGCTGLGFRADGWGKYFGGKQWDCCACAHMCCICCAVGWPGGRGGGSGLLSEAGGLSPLPLVLPLNPLPPLVAVPIGLSAPNALDLLVLPTLPSPPSVGCANGAPCQVHTEEGNVPPPFTMCVKADTARGGGGSIEAE